MEVYVEYALAENFCMDFCLLYAAKRAAKSRASLGRAAAGSALGACFAVFFPLMGLSGAAAVAVKAAAGIALCAAACLPCGIRPFAKFCAAFFALAFVLGGGLLALFSLADISYAAGGGIILSSVPVGIPLFGALCLAVAVGKVASSMLARRAKSSVVCRIYAGQRSVKVAAFFDSGNRVYRRGRPVSVLPSSVARKITDADGIKTYVLVHTVAGDRELPVFTADKVEIDYGEKVITLKGADFCISDAARGRAVLHPDLAEAD